MVVWLRYKIRHSGNTSGIAVSLGCGRSFSWLAARQLANHSSNPEVSNSRYWAPESGRRCSSRVRSVLLTLPGHA